jgi:hypothetical protein
MTVQGGLVGWAERSALRRADNPVNGSQAPGRLQFVFYGRVSTEDWQDPVTSRARQREQAEALVRGHGQIVAEFFDVGRVPDGGVGAAPAIRRLGGGAGRSGPELGRNRDRRI